MTDVERFLAAKTQLCERQHARISPELCRVCRERGDAFCVGCAGLVSTYPLSMVTEEEKSMGCFRGYCASCKKDDRPLISKGVAECSNCYKKRKYGQKTVLKAASMDRTDETWQEEARRELDAKEIPVGVWVSAPEDDQVCPSLSPLPRAEIMRAVLKHGPAVRIDVELMDAWRDRGFTADHIMGLMELVLNDELTVIA